MIDLYFQQRNSLKGKKTLVFIHGSSLNSDIWQNQLASDLFREYRLIAFDLPGHGNSPRLDGYSLKSILQVLYDNIKELEDVVLIAHSIAGNFAIELLNSLPNVRGIVLVGTCPLKKPINMEEAFLPNPKSGLSFKKYLEPEEIEVIIDLNCNQESKSNYNFVQNLSHTDPNFREAIAQIIGNNEFQNHVEILKNSSKPLAIFYSADEEMLNTKYLQSLKFNTLWHNNQVITKSKHCPQIENPNQFNQMLASFLKDLA